MATQVHKKFESSLLYPLIHEAIFNRKHRKAQTLQPYFKQACFNKVVEYLFLKEIVEFPDFSNPDLCQIDERHKICEKMRGIAQDILGSSSQSAASDKDLYDYLLANRILEK